MLVANSIANFTITLGAEFHNREINRRKTFKLSNRIRNWMNSIKIARMMQIKPALEFRIVFTLDLPRFSIQVIYPTERYLMID